MEGLETTALRKPKDMTVVIIFFLNFKLFPTAKKNFIT
jgi:hypothetical protein